MFNKPIQIAKDIEAVRRSALWHLSQRDHSQAELTKKLQRKTDNQSWIDNVINECLENNYLNDQRFCESFINSARNRGLGANKITQDLKRKGISNQLIASLMENSDFDNTDNIVKLLSSRFSESIATPYLKQKATSFLQGKGHQFSDINQAINLFNEGYPNPNFNDLDKACLLLSKKFRDEITDIKAVNKAIRLLHNHGYDYNRAKQAIAQFNQD